MRSYAPVLPLVLYALLITAGCSHVILLAPFLVVQAFCVALYISDVRKKLH